MSGVSDQEGMHPQWDGPALVLLSGGLDSVSALGWAQLKHATVRAITFAYGQPHRDAEVYRARVTAKARGVEWSLADCSEAFRSLHAGKPAGLLGLVEDHDATAAINAAFVPGRNLIFLASALAHAMQIWPDEMHIALIIGCCREDAGAFPDCSIAFLDSAQRTLSLASGRTIRVKAPWAKMPKAGVVDYWITQQHDAEMVQLIRESWSCYRGKDKPCGRCTACVLRLQALGANGFRDDIAAAPVMCGGDVERARKHSL